MVRSPPQKKIARHVLPPPTSRFPTKQSRGKSWKVAQSHGKSCKVVGNRFPVSQRRLDDNKNKIFAFEGWGGLGGREEKSSLVFFHGKRHDNKILKVEILLSRNSVIIAKAPNLLVQEGPGWGATGFFRGVVAATPLRHTRDCGKIHDGGVATPWSATGGGV